MWPSLNKKGEGFRIGSCLPMVGIRHDLMEAIAFSLILEESVFGLFLKRRLLRVITNTQNMMKTKRGIKLEMKAKDES